MKSLRQRAKEIGVSPAYLSRVLSGRQKVSSRVLRLLTDNSTALTENHDSKAQTQNAPNGIRIHVAGLKGRCPRPLDDGGAKLSIAE
jgi:transcriptional regulator with XRE-family HTH domain